MQNSDYDIKTVEDLRNYIHGKNPAKPDSTFENPVPEKEATYDRKYILGPVGLCLFAIGLYVHANFADVKSYLSSLAGPSFTKLAHADLVKYGFKDAVKGDIDGKYGKEILARVPNITFDETTGEFTIGEGDKYQVYDSDGKFHPEAQEKFDNLTRKVENAILSRDKSEMKKIVNSNAELVNYAMVAALSGNLKGAKFSYPGSDSPVSAEKLIRTLYATNQTENILSFVANPVGTATKNIVTGLVLTYIDPLNLKDPANIMLDTSETFHYNDGAKMYRTDEGLTYIKDSEKYVYNESEKRWSREPMSGYEHLRGDPTIDWSGGMPARRIVTPTREEYYEQKRQEEKRERSRKTVERFERDVEKFDRDMQNAGRQLEREVGNAGRQAQETIDRFSRDAENAGKQIEREIGNAAKGLDDFFKGLQGR